MLSCSILYHSISLCEDYPAVPKQYCNRPNLAATSVLSVHVIAEEDNMDWIRRFLQRVHVAPSDEELGHRTSIYAEEGKSRKSGEMEVAYEEPNVVLETSAKLMEFRMLVGSKSAAD